MASKFIKAVSKQAFFKACLYSKQGRGKTLTALLWAEGLAARENKRIAMVDTELGSEFYAMEVPERVVHPAAFDFDRLVTRSIMETVEAVEEIDPAVHGVVILDSITHLWDAAMAAYKGKKMSNGGIPVYAWGDIKRPYKKLMTLLVNGNFHVIICGREGVIMEKDEDGDNEVIGTKVKAEGETGYEPHILGRMFHGTAEGSSVNNVVSVFFEKDRSGVLSGKSIAWPNYATIEPIVKYLTGSGTRQGSIEGAEEKDVEKIEEEKQRQATEIQTLFEQIRTAIQGSASMEALKSAWELTKGKKTKLGDFMEQLETVKETRKSELMRSAAV